MSSHLASVHDRVANLWKNFFLAGWTSEDHLDSRGPDGLELRTRVAFSCSGGASVGVPVDGNPYRALRPLQLANGGASASEAGGPTPDLHDHPDASSLLRRVVRSFVQRAHRRPSSDSDQIDQKRRFRALHSECQGQPVGNKTLEPVSCPVFLGLLAVDKPREMCKSVSDRRGRALSPRGALRNAVGRDRGAGEPQPWSAVRRPLSQVVAA